MKKKSLLVLLIMVLFSTVAFSQTVPKSVIARPGDGIYSLLRKHGLDPSKYYKEFVRLNKKKISKQNGLFIGLKYLLPQKPSEEALKKEVQVDSLPEIQLPQDSLATETKQESLEPEPPEETPPAPEVRKFPIFGKDRADVTIESNELAGAIYYLISGHGGPDPGALAKQSGKRIAEDEYAYDVTLRLARKLMAKGAKVYIVIQDPDDGIRDERILPVDYDEINFPDKRIPRNQRLRLKQRTETVNRLFRENAGSYQRLIVTHVDSRSVGEVIDVFFYHHERSKKGKRLAQNLKETFRKKYARYQPNRKYSGTVAPRSSLYVIKNTLPAMVYIELGNLKNSRDQKRILNYENREALAKWISEGLISDFKDQQD